MEFKNLKDTSYESYVFDTGYVVSECEKGVYKIDGVTLLDKDFNIKDVTMDSFIKVADMNTDSKIMWELYETLGVWIILII